MSEQEQQQTSAQEIVVGAVVKATAVEVQGDHVVVDFGYGQLGKILRKDWSAVSIPSLQDVVQIGDVVDVQVESLNETPILSRKSAVNDETWSRLAKLLDDGTVITVTVLAVVKGGLVADLQGVRAFIPASLLDVKFVSDISSYVMKPLDVVVAEVEPADRRLILSHKRVLELQEQNARQSQMDKFHVGEHVQGTVARLTPFGAFIDLGGIDGLLHISEMSWSRVDRPEDVVQPGQSVEVKILKMEKESGRISLSMKGDRISPWADVADQFHVGDLVTGTVKRLSSFGAFVEVANGIEGLVHVSQISEKRVAQPSDVLSPGQEVQVKILEVHPEEERIALSMKEARRESVKREEKKRVNHFVEKQTTEPAATTLGDLFGDLLRDKFK